LEEIEILRNEIHSLLKVAELTKKNSEPSENFVFARKVVGKIKRKKKGLQNQEKSREDIFRRRS
jgi:hypothetical protein